MDKRFKSPAERLSRYIVSEAGCWEWQGSLFPGGYGHIAPLYGEVSAHRASYAHHHGPIPQGASVLHSCDNRKCINPDHLRLGTYSDNQNDAYSRGRRPRFSGALNVNAKLTEAQARQIIADGRTQAVIAEEYGISTSLVSAIKVGSAWKHLGRNATKRVAMGLR